MRVLVQRVKEASVTINGVCYSAIGPGLLVFLGIEEADTVSYTHLTLPTILLEHLLAAG